VGEYKFSGWFGVIFLGGMLSVASAQQVRPIEIGDAAPNFKLPGVDGKTHSLADYQDAKLLLVVFTCNHCPTAQAYEERIKQLDKDYGPRGVRLVAISPNSDAAVRPDELGWTDLNDSLDDMKARAEAAGFTFPYLYDGETQTVSRAFGAKATPHVFLFDENRMLRYSGRIDNSDVETPTSHDARDAIEALLAGKEIKETETRVFGCSVKWADKIESAKVSIAKMDAQPVTLETIDSEGIKKLVANQTDNYRLINLWATWCGPCVVELPEFEQIGRWYSTRSFEVITISLDRPSQKEGVLDKLKELNVSLTNYLSTVTDVDEFGEALDSAWEGPVPYTLLVAPGGKIVHRVEGEIDPLELRRAIVRHIGRTYASKR